MISTDIEEEKKFEMKAAENACWDMGKRLVCKIEGTKCPVLALCNKSLQ
jgi:hypothetical protein